MSLGSNLRRLRKARGYTLAHLSVLSGVEVGTLSAIEMRDSKRSEYAVPIAHALGVTVEELYGSVSDPPAAVGGERKLSPDEVRVLDLWATLLFDEQRDKVLALLKKEAEAARVAIAQLEKRGYHRATPDATGARHIKPAPRAAPAPEPSARPMNRKTDRPGDAAPSFVRAPLGRREPRRGHHASGNGRPRR